MKKILFSLVALVCSMSMNAQVMKVMKGTTVVATYTADQADNVVLEEEPTITGSAAVKGGGTVNWVQLWAGGPKFAEKNIGATNVTDKGTELTFSQATAEGDDYEWGSLWCTPSKDQMNELLLAATSNGSDKVTCTSTTENGVRGFKFTGKTTGYESNSVFFPAQSGSSSLSAKYLSGTASDGFPWIMYLSRTYGMWESYWSQNSQGLVRPVLKEN